MYCFRCWGSCHIEPKGSRTGNPFGGRVFLGTATAVAYKTDSWGGYGRLLSPGMSSKVAMTVHLKPYWGKPAVRNFREGRGETRSSIEPAGPPSPTRPAFLGSAGNSQELDSEDFGAGTGELERTSSRGLEGPGQW